MKNLGMIATLLLVFILSGHSSAKAEECGSCDWYVNFFHQTRLELEEDLKQESNISRYNLNWLLVEIDIKIQCARQVCSRRSRELSRILLNYHAIRIIITYGKLHSPKPIIN